MQTFCKKNSFSVSWEQANILQDENKSSTNDTKILLHYVYINSNNDAVSCYLKNSNFTPSLRNRMQWFSIEAFFINKQVLLLKPLVLSNFFSRSGKVQLISPGFPPSP